VAVSGKYNISDLAPSLVLLSQRIVERWLLQIRLARAALGLNESG